MIAVLIMSGPAVPFAVAVHGQSTSNGVTTDAPKWALTANLLQVMRGIYFPAANMIFNVQSRDPAQKKAAPPTTSGGSDFDWVQWGTNLYSGWEDVDYAAAMLAEASPLLLTPGRLCSNGKPVPVDRPDWVKYTLDMLAAARKSYEMSRMKNQEAVADSTNDLAEACRACHSVYRDRRAPGAAPGSPANSALRCTAP